MKKSVCKIILSLFCIALICSACQKQMLRPYDFAKVSAHVYDDTSDSTLPLKVTPYLDFDPTTYQDWEEQNALEDYQITKDKRLNKILNATFKFVSKGGYFGRAYINKQNSEIIIAHRGTNFIENNDDGDGGFLSELGKLMNTMKDIDDDLAIFRGKVPPQFRAACHFESKVKEKYKKEFNKNPKIIHTGHSLGAVLAELCAVNYNARAVTFESPGSLPMVKDLLKKEDVNTNKFDITIYNASPNIINSTNQQSGDVIVLKSSKEDSTKKKSNISIRINQMSTDQHGIEEVIDMFDPKTGEPKKIEDE